MKRLDGQKASLRNAPAIIRFRRSVVIAESGCHLWTGATAGAGYGVLSVGGRMVYAHRFSYEYETDTTIPPGLTIDHLCRVPACVNRDHLEVVTQKENLRRSTAVQAMKAWAATITHCPKGHEYTTENTRVNRGKRHCKICTAAAGRAYDAAHREERAEKARIYRARKSVRALEDAAAT